MRTETLPNYSQCAAYVHQTPDALQQAYWLQVVLFAAVLYALYDFPIYSNKIYKYEYVWFHTFF